MIKKLLAVTAVGLFAMASSQAMAVELRPTSSVRDTMWATLDRRTRPKKDGPEEDSRLTLAGELPYQRQHYRPVSNQPTTEPTNTKSQETWSNLVEEVFDDMRSPWELDL